MGAHPAEVYFWITLSSIILGGREEGLNLFLWAQILIIDLQYLCFAAALVLADSGNAIVEPFFASMALRSSHFQTDQYSDY